MSVQVCINLRKVNVVSQFDAHGAWITGEATEPAAFVQTRPYEGVLVDLLNPFSSMKKKMAFASPQGPFPFTHKPFGLHRAAAAALQRLRDRVFRDHQVYTATCIDNITMYSPSWDQHLNGSG